MVALIEMLNARHQSPCSSVKHWRRWLCFAKILCALKIARFPAATAVPSRLSLHPRAPRVSPGEAPARFRV